MNLIFDKKAGLENNTGRDKIEADFVCYRCRRNILGLMMALDMGGP